MINSIRASVLICTARSSRLAVLERSDILIGSKVVLPLSTLKGVSGVNAGEDELAVSITPTERFFSTVLDGDKGEDEVFSREARRSRAEKTRVRRERT